jgi:hypothetical protein
VLYPFSADSDHRAAYAINSSALHLSDFLFFREDFFFLCVSASLR